MFIDVQLSFVYDFNELFGIVISVSQCQSRVIYLQNALCRYYAFLHVRKIKLEPIGWVINENQFCEWLTFFKHAVFIMPQPCYVSAIFNRKYYSFFFYALLSDMCDFRFFFLLYLQKYRQLTVASGIYKDADLKSTDANQVYIEL